VRPKSPGRSTGNSPKKRKSSILPWADGRGGFENTWSHACKFSSLYRKSLGPTQKRLRFQLVSAKWAHVHQWRTLLLQHVDTTGAFLLLNFLSYRWALLYFLLATRVVRRADETGTTVEKSALSAYCDRILRDVLGKIFSADDITATGFFQQNLCAEPSCSCLQSPSPVCGAATRTSSNPHLCATPSGCHTSWWRH